MEYQFIDLDNIPDDIIERLFSGTESLYGKNYGWFAILQGNILSLDFDYECGSSQCSTELTDEEVLTISPKDT